MLPFLKSKKDVASPGLIVKHRVPDEKPQEDQDDPSAAHEAVGQAIIDAIAAGDAKAVASAIQDAFQLADSMPHEEGPHTNESEEI